MNSINWSSVRIFTPAMIITTGLLTADSAWADPCTDPVAQTALNTRALQTELMVAALSCGNRIHYNAFVIKYQGDLVKHGRSLQSFFQRKHGAAGRKNLNTFITRGWRYHQRVCKKVKAMYPFCSNRQRTGWQAREKGAHRHERAKHRRG